MCVKFIAIQWWDVFESRCICMPFSDVFKIKNVVKYKKKCFLKRKNVTGIKNAKTFFLYL